MARLYADEQFPRPVIDRLRERGHDILTVQEAGSRGVSDEAVLAYATSVDRAVLTLNRQDFFRLHRSQPSYAGIIACKDSQALDAMADYIHEAVSEMNSLAGKVIRVNRSGWL